MLRDRAFTVADARSAQVPLGRLRRADLDRTLWGVRAPRAPDLPMRCRAALTFLPPGSAVAHGTALRLAGVDLPARLEADDRVHVRVPPGSGRARRQGVVVHHTELPFAVHDVGGVPTVGTLQAWLDCAGQLGPDDLVVVGDGLLRRQAPLHTLEELAGAVIALRPGTRGVARLRAAVPLLAERTDSPMETRTRLVLVRGGLPAPEVNQPVLDPTGRFLALADLMYRKERVVVEYDGDVHRVDRATWQRDVARRNRLQAAGWWVITATAELVHSRPAVLVGMVRHALAERSR